MSSNLVIVALPRKGEEVTKVSTEKAAHVTLLFLGEDSDVSEEIVQYVEHAVRTSFHPTYVEVSNRGTLGPDEADVLFLDGYGARQLAEFRSLLLKDPNIKRLYDSVEQYPQFTPHLTLGYPDNPAKEPEHEYGLESFMIDRIAVWTEDSDGPEFKPPWHDWTEDVAGTSLAYSDVVNKGNDVLSHYGVKGMKWGVVNEDETGGDQGVHQNPKAADLESRGKAIAAKQGIDTVNLQRKYGPDNPAQAARDHEVVKKIAIGAGVGVAVAGIGFAAYKYKQAGGGGFDGGMELNKDFAEALTDPKKMAALNAKHLVDSKVRDLSAATMKAQAAGMRADGLASNWEKGVSLDAGSVIKRLSSVAETEPRASGFFGSHLSSDVESYKAVLPSFWRSWGMGDAANGGFINHYKAREAIKAPSGKETFEIFKDLIQNNPEFNNHFKGPLSPMGIKNMKDDTLKNYMVQSSVNWALPDNPYTKQFTAELKKRGFNAVIDFNDAGKLGKTPLKILDGSIFDIVKNEPQTLDDLHAAAKAWSPELLHFLNLMGVSFVSEVDLNPVEALIHKGQDILEHYGVKGMKWGVRKRKDGNSNTVVSIGSDRKAQKVKTNVVKVGPKSTIVTTKGGHNPVHPDAVKAKKAAQKRKRSGVDTLSNQELRALADRMNLEQRIAEMDQRKWENRKKVGRKWINNMPDTHFDDPGVNAAIKQVKKKLG